MLRDICFRRPNFLSDARNTSVRSLSVPGKISHSCLTRRTSPAPFRPRGIVGPGRRSLAPTPRQLIRCGVDGDRTSLSASSTDNLDRTTRKVGVNLQNVEAKKRVPLRATALPKDSQRMEQIRKGSRSGANNIRVSRMEAETLEASCSAEEEADDGHAVPPNSAQDTKVKTEKKTKDLQGPQEAPESSTVTQNEFGRYLSDVRLKLGNLERNPEQERVGQVSTVRHGVSNFLHEIGKTKVLTKEEEILLATNVQDHSKVARACLYFKKEEGREPTDAELCSLFNMEISEIELLRKTSRRSKQLLVEHNLKLVVSVAKRYIGRGVALEDLIQEGITARIKKMSKQFEEENGRKPTREEVAEAVGLPTERVSILQNSAYDVSSLDEAETYRAVDGQKISSPIVVADDNCVDDPLSICETHMLQEDLNAVLSTLAPRERNVLRMHYGLMANDGEEMTLTDIGTTYGLSRERIRQIESTAIDKLRHPLRALPLAEHIATNNSSSLH